MKFFSFLLIFLSVFILSCTDNNTDTTPDKCDEGYKGTDCTECADNYIKQSKYCIYDCTNIENVDKVNDANNSCICKEGYSFDKASRTCNKIESCDKDRDCELGFICELDVCIAGCRADRDCESNEVCNQTTSKCEENNPNACSEDRDCELGFICESDACIEGCRVDRDCSDNKTCNQTTNKCENENNPNACSDDRDCDLGSICESDTCTEGCRVDRDCSDNKICNQTTNKCETNNPDACSEDRDCEIGFICELDVCIAGCRLDRDCESNEVCNQTTNKCEENNEACQLYVTNIENDVVDFGDISIDDDSVTRDIALINIGNVDCTINSIEVTSDISDIFKLEYFAGYPEITAPIIIQSRENTTVENGNQYVFKAAFKPRAERLYTGKIIINSPNSSWIDNKKEISLLGTGTNVNLPVAKCSPSYFAVEPAIDNPNNPVSIITLNGAQSYDPSGEHLTYRWEKVSGPVGSTAMPRTPTSANSNYFIDLAGEHKIKLTVTNESGKSASCEVTAVGITSNALHIELFWDKDGDLDLHLKKFGTPDSDWGSILNDCYWNNLCKSDNGLEWGESGTMNNPRLDRDDMQGRGPENINIDFPAITPEDEYYLIGVRNFSNSAHPVATIVVYCNGEKSFTESMSLPGRGDEPDSFWWVAGIEWSNSGCNIKTDDISKTGLYPGAQGTR